MFLLETIRVRSWALLLWLACAVSLGEEPRDPVDRRVYGLLIGSLIGDAAGGPVEFASAEKVAGLLPGYRDRPGVRLDGEGIERLAEAFPLLPYDPIRPDAEPYGPWSPRAPAGTVTDDTRNKMILIDALRDGLPDDRGGAPSPLSRRGLAEAYLRFGDRPEVRDTPGWRALCDEGFGEFLLAARWVRGERDPLASLPPSRLWNGVGTCCGQMALPPLAGVYPGEPARAYRVAYDAAFIDNGDAKDLNAAIVAGLAFALAQPSPGDDSARRVAAWRGLLDAMRATDPLRHADVPFMGRELDRWIDAGVAASAGAGGSPAELYRRIDAACPHRYGWEANFLLVEVVALGEFTGGDPLAAMHLALDYGADTDSAAQLLGALFGAIHGPEIFPAAMRQTVEDRLGADYGESLDEWLVVLRAARLATQQTPGS